MSAPPIRDTQASAGLAPVREYKDTLGIPAANGTLEAAWRYHEAIRNAHRGRLPEAIAEYKRLLELDPDEPVHYLDLAEIYLKKDAVKEAVVVLLALTDLYERLGMPAAALEVQDRAVRLDASVNGQTASVRSEPTAHPSPQASLPTDEQAGRRNSAGPVETVGDRASAAAQDAVEPVPQPPPPAAGVASPTDGPAAQAPEVPSDRTPPRTEASNLPTLAKPDRARTPLRPGGVTTRKDPLGEILVRMGLITEDQLSHAIDVQAKTGEKIGQILLRQGAVTEEDLAKAVGVQWGYPYVALSTAQVDPEAVRMVPHHLSIRHKVMAFGRNGNRLLVAVVDPLNLLALDDVRLITGLDVDARVTTESELQQAINKHYHVGNILDQTAAGVEVTDEVVEEEISLDKLRQMVDEAPVIKLVNVILDQAIREGASDIHIEPYRQGIHVRYRIDGVLHDVMSPPKNLKAALVSRIKIVANLDIAERRRPQDGRIHLRVDGKEIDLRVSTLPTMFGEKVVMRILDQSSALISLGRLGMASDVQEQWETLASKPYGMILVTGPTGSGKTTTLYATLSKINTLDKNIITVEDPVEYQLPRINQVQVNPKAGLTFATGLRAILRQDPDVVMVGEIRDRETAEIAVQAALTGHLVLSTLHTNDAASAFTRLIDMGIEPFLISSSVIGVLAQRLARQICPRCKESYRAPRDAVRRLSEELSVGEELMLYRGAGCDNCRRTGYKGRTGVYELLTVNDRIRELVVARASSNVIKEAAREEGFRTMREDGIQKVLSGQSTIEEILRVVYVTDQ
ncbi:MAG: type II secretion system ATPase GspE [Armatimonadota bacterium]|nr:type II secretion system ATPase GspE [Armatimonadota bacterium]MDR5696575.1 type II secretion system ATPase GspE [Armatimonadota bacterium]